MTRVTHFEIMSSEPDQLINFYRNVFDWEITKWDGSVDYWLVKTGPGNHNGIDGAIKKRVGSKPIPESPISNFTCTIDVSDIDKYINSSIDHGAKIEQPKMAIPGLGWHCYLRDPDGNLFGLMENDPQAKP